MSKRMTDYTDTFKRTYHHIHQFCYSYERVEKNVIQHRQQDDNQQREWELTYYDDSELLCTLSGTHLSDFSGRVIIPTKNCKGAAQCGRAGKGIQR